MNTQIITVLIASAKHTENLEWCFDRALADLTEKTRVFYEEHHKYADRIAETHKDEPMTPEYAILHEESGDAYKLCEMIAHELHEREENGEKLAHFDGADFGKLIDEAFDKGQAEAK